MDGLDKEGWRGRAQLDDQGAKARFEQREGDDRTLGCQSASQTVVIRQWRGGRSRMIVFGPVLPKRAVILLLASGLVQAMLMMMQGAQPTSQEIG
jgi:hypothetical protein